MSSNEMYARAMPGAGWIGFAGIMLILVGFFNIIDGLAAIRVPTTSSTSCCSRTSTPGAGSS